MAGGFFNTIFPLIKGGEGDLFAQAGLWQANGGNVVYTFRSTGILTNSPTAALDVNGRTRTRGNATFDSSATAMKMLAEKANFITLLVTGIATVDALAVNTNATISGSLIVSGNTQLADVAANNATVSGQLSVSNITSPSGNISLGNNNLSTTGNISSGNISSLTADVSNLQSSISHIQSSQWTTNPDSSIAFNGNIFVKNLGVSEAVSIGNFRFNGGAQPYPVDTMRSMFPIAISSGAEKIMLDADSVMLGNTARVGSGQLSVQGDIAASGNLQVGGTVNVGTLRADTMRASDIRADSTLKVANSILIDGTNDRITSSSGIINFQNTNLTTSGNITASGLHVSGQVNLDSVHIASNIQIGNSTIMINGVTNEIYTKPTAPYDLFIQSTLSTNNTIINPYNGKVGIGTVTPGAKLDVNTSGGNFKFDGSGSAGYTTTFGMDNIGLKIGHNSTYRDIEFIISSTRVITLLPSGNVGIGVANPTNELEVCGTIRSKEWIVETFGCDFVFDEKYKRPTYFEKEKWFKEKKHLRGIAPAKEIESRGMKAGETLSGIIMNVEENSLDIIDLQKENEQLKEKLNKQEQEIQWLKQQINEIIEK